jgi:hypothetical protein
MKRSLLSVPQRLESTATAIRVLLAIVGLTLMAGCGGSNSPTTTTTGTPAVTLAPATFTTFTSGVGVASAAQSVTVTDSGTAALTFTSITTSNAVFAENNTCGTGIAAGGTCSISVTFTPTAAGTVTGTLTITDNASGSPQTVSLTGTGASVGVSPSSLSFSPSVTSQNVTLTNSSSSALAVTSIGITTGGTNFAQTNTCGTSVAANGSCAIIVTFTAPTSGTVTGTLTIAYTGGSQTVNLTGSAAVVNTVPVSVNLGPAGNYDNGIFTTVTVCEPSSPTTCATVQNVLVDTGSVGLRVLSSALTGVTLSQINDGQGDNLNECTEYGDGSFNWGPVSMATVQIGGETASQVPTSAGGTPNSGIPIQIISADPVPTNVTGSGICVNTTNTPDEDTVASLGSNGILGVGNFPQDCGIDCTTTTGISGLQYPPYWACTTAGVCEQATVGVAAQVWNPVAAFSSSDTNGVLLTLPSISATGQATAAGTLTFGIGTESNNAITNQTVYELDGSGNFNSATFNGITYTSSNSSGSFIDSGSNAFFVSDAATLGTTLCTTDTAYYCPSLTLNLSLTLTGSNNGSSGTVSLPIANAQTLFSNTTFAAFNDLGSPSCIATATSLCNTSTDQWDLGLPFFFGRPIFVGISGGTTYPNGYWAF